MVNQGWQAGKIKLYSRNRNWNRLPAYRTHGLMQRIRRDEYSGSGQQSFLSGNDFFAT